MPRRRDPRLARLDVEQLAALLTRQDGVINRRQLLAVGADDADLERMLRRRELVRLARAVFACHTGPLTASQRDWAALADESALAAVGSRRSVHSTDERQVHVAVALGRNVQPPPWIRVHYVAGLDRHVLWNASPPRMTPEVAALRVAGRATDDVAAVGILTDAVNRRVTTPKRLLDALEHLPSCRRRRWQQLVLLDLNAGACSTLEHGYLHRVERAHALPAAARQSVRRGAAGREYRDVEYERFGLVVELDGKAFHETSEARDRDLERDLDDRVVGRETVRLSWAQVFRHPCRTAGKIATILRRRGWTGAAHGCGPACVLAA